MKLFIVIFFILSTACIHADELWQKAITIYEHHLQHKPNPDKGYILFETGASNSTNSNEVWEEYKYENNKSFRKILKINKNGIDQPIPSENQDKWYEVTDKKKDEKTDYKGIDEIFFSNKQHNVTYKKTGNSKIIFGKVCQEYSFVMKKNTRGKPEEVVGNAYIDTDTGAPYEIRRTNTSAYMKGTPDSFVTFSYDGQFLYTRHVLLIMNINFMGKQQKIKTEVRLDYNKLNQ